MYLYYKPTYGHYKYVQSHIVILQQHISVTVLTIIRVAYNNNTINMQIMVQTCMILHEICKSNVTPSGCIIYFCTLIYILDSILIISQLIMVTGGTETCWWKIILWTFFHTFHICGINVVHKTYKQPTHAH
jgi:hypothetical protein